MRIESVHAGTDEGHVLIAKTEQGAQRRAQITTVGDLAEHGVVPARVQIAFAFFKDDARVTVILFGFAAQDAPGLFFAHADLAAKRAQLFHAFIAHPFGMEQQALRQFRPRGDQRQRGKQAQGIAVRQLARIDFQFRHALTPFCGFYDYYTGRSPKKRGVNSRI